MYSSEIYNQDLILYFQNDSYLYTIQIQPLTLFSAILNLDVNNNNMCCFFPSFLYLVDKKKEIDEE